MQLVGRQQGAQGRGHPLIQLIPPLGLELGRPLEHPGDRQLQRLLGDGLDQEIIDAKGASPALGPLIMVAGQKDEGDPAHLGILHQLLAQGEAVDPLHLDVGEHQIRRLASQRLQGRQGIGKAVDLIVVVQIAGEQGAHHLVIVDHRHHGHPPRSVPGPQDHPVAPLLMAEAHFLKQAVHQRQTIAPLLRLCRQGVGRQRRLGPAVIIQLQTQARLILLQGEPELARRRLPMTHDIGGELAEAEQPVGLLLGGNLKQRQPLRQTATQLAYRLQGGGGGSQPLFHIVSLRS